MRRGTGSGMRFEMASAFGARVPIADMRVSELGRTYRYADPSDVLYGFGSGLSYTTFSLTLAGISSTSGVNLISGNYSTYAHCAVCVVAFYTYALMQQAIFICK